VALALSGGLLTGAAGVDTAPRAWLSPIVPLIGAGASLWLAGLAFCAGERCPAAGGARAQGRTACILVAAFFCLGFGRGTEALQQAQLQVAAAARVEGLAWVQGTLERNGSGWWLAVDRIRTSGHRQVASLCMPLRLRLPGLDARCGAHWMGDRVEGFLWIEAATGPRVPGGWDGRRFLASQMAGGTGWLHGSLNRVAVAAGRRSAGRLHSWSDPVREWAAQRLDEAFPGSAGRFVCRFLLGRRPGQGDEAAAMRLRDCGVGHFLTISGFHVGCVFGALVILLNMLGLPSGARRWLLALLLPGYALVSGGGLAVQRAVGLVVLCLAARGLRRRLDPRVALLMMLAVTLWHQPLAWKLPGLQLSYTVTWALLRVVGAWGAEPIGGDDRGPVDPRAKVDPRGKVTRVWRRRLGLWLGCGITAQCAAWPLSLAHWGGSSPLFVVVNLLFAPLAAGFMLLGAAGIALGSLPGFPAALACRAGGRWVASLNGPLESVADACRATSVAGGLSEPLAILLALAVAWVAGQRVLQRRLRMAGTIGLAGMGVLLCPSIPSCGMVVMLDVGQGDCYLVMTPGATWMIDTGPAPAEGQNPYWAPARALRWYGRHHIDCLILTHDDADHSGGLAGLAASRITVGQIWMGAGAERSERTETWLQALAARRGRLRRVRDGDRLQDGSLSLRVHHLPGGERGRSRNEDCLAIELTLRGGCVWLWGDLPGPLQQRLMGRLPEEGLVAMSAAHHGSAGSTPRGLLTAGRLAAAGPTVAGPSAERPAAAGDGVQEGAPLLLVSVGRRNRFGHPDHEVLEAARQTGWRILRTDRVGTVEIRATAEGWEARATARRANGGGKSGDS